MMRVCLAVAIGERPLASFGVVASFLRASIPRPRQCRLAARMTSLRRALSYSSPARPQISASSAPPCS